MSLRIFRANFVIAALVACARMASAAPPPSPGALSARGTAAGTVTVTWNASPGATEYRVYADADPVIGVLAGPPIVFFVGANARLVATVTGTSAVETGLPALVRRYYAVVAVNADGNSQPAFGPVVIVPADPDATIFGLADLHTHQFSNLGFGRHVIWGNAFSPVGIFDALPTCDEVHGLAGSQDIVGNFLSSGSPIAFHNTGGGASGAATEFDGWPAFNSYTHQQMYYEWLRRAFEGGLRLIVMHAVNNKLLCDYTDRFGVFSCEDMDNVDGQLDMAKSLEAFIDGQSGGPGLGWYRIAYSATEARHIINSGKMAVVLGIEVDNLFDCSVNSSSCDASHVTTELDRYYGKGVRHLFPVHVFDNAFGGAALYNPLFNWGNKFEEGRFFTPRECSAEGYRYKQGAPDLLESLVILAFGLPTPPSTTFTAECNDRGLQPIGDTLIRAMMTRKMIVDVDHMSARTADSALNIAEEIDYPAVVGGHTGALSIASGQQANEGLKSATQLSRIRALGGMIGVGLIGDRVTPTNPNGLGPAPGSTVIEDCGWSSKVFAQALQAGVAAFGGAATAAVGIGSDFNGLAGAPGPRFGNNACRNDRSPSPQTGGVAYPFSIFAPAGVNAGHLGAPNSPDRIVRDNPFATPHSAPWDYNLDGVAHVGFLPDFIQDLRTIGMSDAQITPLFRSAEAYIRMWERAEAMNINPPTAAASQSPAPGASGWSRSDVTVSMSGTPSSGGPAVTALTYASSGALTSGPTTVNGTAADLIVSSEGTTTVSVTARDAFKNVSAPAGATVKLDRTAPGITCQSADGLWHASDVAIACAATDVVSGLASGGDAAFSLTTSVPADSETASASTGSGQVFDVAGNSATAGPISGNRVDKKAPVIAITVPAGGSYTVGQVINAGYDCSDGGSGKKTCAGPVASGAPLDTSRPGTVSFVVNSTDQVDNASSATATYNVGYAVCLQYDATRVKRLGAVVPIKIQLCDNSGVNLSASTIVVTATSLTRAASTVSGVLDDAGNANPDGNFRFDAATGTYIYNLSTRGLTAGTWSVNFSVSGDPTSHSVTFQVQ